MDSLYPAGPESVPAKLTSPSKNYRRHAWFAMAGLLGFMLAYLALLCWFVWTAYRLFAGAFAGSGGGDSLINLGTGALAAFLAFFMAKALVFKKRAKTASDDIELKPEQQPELFAFLHRLADDAGAPRPHRVYVAANVNAGVFYDLSLINLVFPSRKNLEIGLGLVNVLNLGEFKAVLAHEFGHFAQRSMAVGRWVYIAQQIATHIVGKRDALDSFLAALSRMDFRIAWVGWLLSLIIWSIRSLIEIAFRGVVLAQRALSREMEYQADLVSASLTGSDALVHALHRLGAADEAWSRALQFASRELSKQRPVKDLFVVQTRIIEHMRVVLADPEYGQPPVLPQHNPEAHRVFREELAPSPQMWSTHPPSAAREANIKQTYISCPIDERPASALLRDWEGLKEGMSKGMLSGDIPEFASASESLKRLDDEYASLPLSRRYRGTYLGRSFVRSHAQLSELYLPIPHDADLIAQLDTLYSPAHGDNVERLRELEQQRATLEAVRKGILKTEGGMLHWRGSRIPAKSLPLVVTELEKELEPLRRAVTEHDQRCRSLHVAAAAKVGTGWSSLLRGQLAVLHYAEHAQADVENAQALLANTYAIITADGRVSAAELRKLVAACNQVQSALDAVYAQSRQLTLDEKIAAKLNVAEWSELLEKFTLPRASEQNINEWMKVVDGWVRATLGPLSTLRNAALESLLETEDDIEQQVRSGRQTEGPTQFSSVPDEYITLLPGKERRMQHKLGLWDQFQTADGFIPGTARVAVAGGIVGAVLLLGGAVGLTKVSIFNGMARAMEVEIDGETVTVQPFKSAELTLPNQPKHKVQARTADAGDLVESFDGEAPSGGPHLVYNIAGAAPLIEWTATYGAAAAVPETRLGSVRWTQTQAEHVFSEPPESIQSKSGNGTRTVLSALSNAAPSLMLGALKDPTKEAPAMVDAHARWDAGDTRYVGEWLWRAQEAGTLAATIEQRLKRNPNEVITLRLEQEMAKGQDHDAVCARHRALAEESPAMASLNYIATRCITDARDRDDAFVAGHARWPDDPWFAMAAGYVHSERKQWEQALPLMERGSKVPELAEGVALDLARLKRGMSDVRASELAALAEQSSYLGNLLALESGQGADGSPYAAFRYLAEGDLQRAMGIAATDASLAPRVLRLAGASDGADPELVARMLALPLDAGADDLSLWTTLAAAAREGRDTAALRKAVLASDPESAPAIARFFDAVRAGATPSVAEAALGDVDLRSRGIAYSTAVILKGERCPTEWRETAKRLLFAAERPYFS